ncbi:MAG: hypothetical protein HYY20_09765 [Candidatus Tectomicrobia bacterium]|uniref:Radical SAM core domain-containing protein n=1 Tax=Tectimicrobiota bacterium TaxID=2528274 RepID=A0A932FVW4_UNCTE|nr:hypothetical protein [Candidatus Tectomicrobia bacterium]
MLVQEKTRTFPERISPFLRRKLDSLRREQGEDSPPYRGLALQYVKDEREDQEGWEENLKHYEAQLEVKDPGGKLPGLERLYRRTLVIELTLACAAHCRHCLRKNYPLHTLSEAQLVEVARHCGAPEHRGSLNEILITGGDPLTVPGRLHFFIEALREYAPNIQTIRIGSRLMSQYPEKIDETVFSIFRNKPGLRFELATQINHPVEFFPEVCEVFGRFRELGVKIYAQNVLLQGVNDEIDTLVELYDRMRRHDIEPHYLFHCVPIKGIHHLRTSVSRGLQLIRELVAGGKVSGRVKPMYAAMTDIGKITFYEGVILGRRDGRLLLQSNYRVEDRMAYNPSWQIPPTAEVDESGYLRVWYLDGND